MFKSSKKLSVSQFYKPFEAVLLSLSVSYTFSEHGGKSFATVKWPSLPKE
jgi:hypothetical protein